MRSLERRRQKPWFDVGQTAEVGQTAGLRPAATPASATIRSRTRPPPRAASPAFALGRLSLTFPYLVERPIPAVAAPPAAAAGCSEFRKNPSIRPAASIKFSIELA